MPQRIDIGKKKYEAGDHHGAAAAYLSYLKDFPDDWYAAYLYGTMLLLMDSPGTAQVWLKRASQLNPGYIPVWSNLGIAYKNCGRDAIALTTLEHAVVLVRQTVLTDSQDQRAASDALGNLASVLIHQGRNAEALALLDEALVLSPQHAVSQWNRGLVYLIQKRWPEGWAGYEWGIQANERKSLAHAARFARWQGQPLAGKTILVWGEQGIGDEILFANAIPQLCRDAGRVVLDCHPRLETIFQRSFPDAEVIGRRKDLRALWALGMGIDYQVPAGSLMGTYRCNQADFPVGTYLTPDSSRVEFWKRQIPGKLRIGVHWRGGHHGGAYQRSLPLRDFETFMRPLADVAWVSLQYGDKRSYEIEEFRTRTGIELVHSDYAIEDYNETCNLIASCDLVISVVTAAVHTAGALGVPCWTLVPVGPAWKFVEGEVLPWHASVRQFHQAKPLIWDDVLMRIRAELSLWFKERDIPYV